MYFSAFFIYFIFYIAFDRKSIIKNNSKLLLGIIIGIAISGTGVYATILYASSDVGYDNTGSGMSATNVQDALDELYTKSQNVVVDANSIDFNTVRINTGKTILASRKGVCINRNDILNCFKINNWNIENHKYFKVKKKHLLNAVFFLIIKKYLYFNGIIFI